MNQIREYFYDAQGSLIKSFITKADVEKEVTLYRYDAVGNRISMDNNGEVTSYSYNELILRTNGR